MTEKYPGIFKSLVAHKNLCRNAAARSYCHYGGRGIEYRLPEQAEAACQALLAELGPRPLGHTLDRIDVNGHFELGNLRWATAKQQSNNRRIRPTAAEWESVCDAFPTARELLLSLRASR